MDEREVAELEQTLAVGLKKCFEDMLERKALLGQSIVTCDAEGNTVVIPAKQALADYRAGKSH